MSGPFDDFLASIVADCVNGSSGEWPRRKRNYDDTDMTPEQWREQDRYDDEMTLERYEKKGRFASGPDDDPYAKDEEEG